MDFAHNNYKIKYTSKVLSEKFGLDSVESRHRIDQRVQSRAGIHLGLAYTFAEQMILNRYEKQLRNGENVDNIHVFIKKLQNMDENINNS